MKSLRVLGVMVIKGLTSELYRYSYFIRALSRAFKCLRGPL